VFEWVAFFLTMGAPDGAANGPALVHVGKVWQHQDFSGITHLFFP
jgi:hypothetical protein